MTKGCLPLIMGILNRCGNKDKGQAGCLSIKILKGHIFIHPVIIILQSNCNELKADVLTLLN